MKTKQILPHSQELCKRAAIKSSLIVLLLLTFNSLVAQSEAEIKEKGIKSKTFYVQNIEDGEKEPVIDKIESYDEHGRLIDLKIYDREGKNIKDWFQYKYNEAGLIIEEVEYDSRSRLKERIVHIYKGGLKVEKHYFDDKERMTKKKVYEYQY
jgi:hypothetical protein